jgi:hypothetical protein
MDLHKISLPRLHVLETGQFIVRYISNIEGLTVSPATDPIFNELHASILKQSPILNKSIAQIKAREESQQLINLDSIRDKSVTTLRSSWNLHKHSKIAAEKEAYAKIKVILNNYKGIEIENYEAETLGIYNLVNELRKPENLTYSETLGMVRFINELETDNTNFKDIFSKRSNNDIGTEVFDTKKLRIEIMTTYEKLTAYIVVMADRLKTPYYIDILTAINNGRKYYADILAKRKGKSGNEDVVQQ